MAAAGVASSILYSSALVVLRGRPGIDADAGIFLSVAARLVHGDHLYTGVWDHKPPFFYYAQALAFDLGGWRGPFLLDAFWVSIATISIWLLLRAIGVSPWTRTVGAAVYPLMLTGAWYYAGYSELPALALAPAILWLSLRRSTLAAGGILGITLFFRFDYGLTLFAATVVAIGAGADGGVAFRREALRALLGLVTGVSASVAFLAARGELIAYVHTMWWLAGYLGRTLVHLGESPGIVGHVTVALRIISEDRLRAILFGLVAAALIALPAMALRRRARGQLLSDRSEPGWALTLFFLATAAATAVTLAFSALWDHGLEQIALPAALGTCLLAATVEHAVQRPSRRLVAVTATAAVCCVAFGGLSLDRSAGSPEASRPISQWWHTPRSVSAEALDEAAARGYGPAAKVTYARLGPNTDDAHAAFIRPGFELACPVFHQYAFSANLDETLACLRERLPDLVLVGPSFTAANESTSQNWDVFVSAARRLLQDRYVESLTMPDRGGTVEVWQRR
jgi:hypothetical protein